MATSLGSPGTLPTTIAVKSFTNYSLCTLSDGGAFPPDFEPRLVLTSKKKIRFPLSYSGWSIKLLLYVLNGISPKDVSPVPINGNLFGNRMLQM